MLPRSCVATVVDKDAGAEGSHAGDGEVGKSDDGGVTGPFDGDGEGDRDILIAVLHPRVQEPEIALKFFSFEDSVFFFVGRGIFAVDGELPGEHGTGEGFREFLFELFLGFFGRGGFLFSECGDRDRKRESEDCEPVGTHDLAPVRREMRGSNQCTGRGGAGERGGSD